MSVRDDTNLELVGRRIRGLLSKRVENGATEEEAILAAMKARELMDKYRVTMTDIEVKEEEVMFSIIERGSAVRATAVDNCISGIARYCGVKMWFKMVEGVRYVAMIGLTADVDMARYLYEMLAAAIKSTSRTYRGEEKKSFQVGMAIRLNERLIQMARDLEPTAKTASGTALVVVKTALVDAAWNDLGIKFRGSFQMMSARDGGAYSAGRAAGDRVNLNRPVESSHVANKLLR